MTNRCVSVRELIKLIDFNKTTWELAHNGRSPIYLHLGWRTAERLWGKFIITDGLLFGMKPVVHASKAYCVVTSDTP